MTGPGGRDVPVPCSEHLAALKVQAMKNDPERVLGDLDDIRFLLRLPGVDGDEVRGYFERAGLTDRWDDLRRLGRPESGRAARRTSTGGTTTWTDDVMEGELTGRPASETFTGSRILRLDRDLPTTADDVAVLRRLRHGPPLGLAEYLELLAGLDPPPTETLRARRGPSGAPFDLLRRC